MKGILTVLGHSQNISGTSEKTAALYYKRGVSAQVMEQLYGTVLKRIITESLTGARLELGTSMEFSIVIE